MNKFAIITIVVTILFFVGGILLATKPKDKNVNIELPTSYEYFWGDGCPHCANVQAFFDEWEGKDKVQIEKKEVWSNTNNAKLMRQRAEYCNIPPTGMGVPLLFTPQGKCLSGDTPIIDYFKNLEL